MGILKKKVQEAKDEPNPNLQVEHNHEWLPANDGKEYVCGICGTRIDAGLSKPGVHEPEPKLKK